MTEIKQADYLEKAKRFRVSGVVYCLQHGCIHDDTLDPYAEGSATCLEDVWPKTRASVHRTVFAGLRAGDQGPDDGVL